MIGHEDWERFLSSIERLMTLQERTIERQKELNHRNEVLKRELKGTITVGTSFNPSLRSVDAGSRSGDRTRSVTERVLEWLKVPSAPPSYQRQTDAHAGQMARHAAYPLVSLPTSPSLPPPLPIIQCGNCGYGVTTASAVCVRCGVSFGACYCRCGRILLPRDAFCDSCGQAVA
jgi:hypothetical protein